MAGYIQFKNEDLLEYFKTDKNGTKYYYDYTCPRCGGAGGADQWTYTGWTCYKCGGTGKLRDPKIVKKYTPEYQAILDQRRADKAAREQAEFEANKPQIIAQRNADFLADHHFSPDGKIYIFLGDTYSYKDEIKSLGGKFDYFLGWHIDHEVNNWDLLEMTADELFEINEDGQYMRYRQDITRDDIEGYKKAALKEINNEPESEYYGEIGQKIDLTLKYVDRYTYTTYYTYKGEVHNLIKFVNEAGQIFVWDTQSFNEEIIDADPGTLFHVTGTIKKHNEYKGEKQTVLTRCKVSK